MKTEDLIRAVVADNASVAPPIQRTLMLALAAGCAVAAVVFAATLGVRSDFWWSLANSPRFVFKFVFTLAVAAAGYLVVVRMARPDARPGARVGLLMLPAVLLAGAVLVEMAAIPRDHWPVYAVGSKALACVSLIPLLSLAPFAAIMYALRQGAPANPKLAGAIGGLLAAGIGATLYASHCADDSPLFVSIWYSIAIAAMTAAGGMLGARFLKW